MTLRQPQPRLCTFLSVFSVLLLLGLGSCRNRIQGVGAPVQRETGAEGDGKQALPFTTPMPDGKPSIEKPTVRIEYGQSGSYLVVHRGKTKTYSQLDSHTIYWVKGNSIADSISGIVSGQGYAQEYRTKNNTGPWGSMRPVPEGIYSIGPGVSSGDDGIRGAFYSMLPNPSPRGDFGLHLDANRSRAPGTAGCLGFPDKESFAKFKSWMSATDKPRRVVVDWNLGSLPQPQAGLLGLLDLFDNENLDLEQWDGKTHAIEKFNIDEQGEVLN
jgi:hypothetical protein